MTFTHPLLLLTLLLIPAAVVAYRLATRRRMEYAVRYTNVDLLASVVATGRPWRRWLMAGVFLLALAALCAALSRPQVHTLVVNDNATVVLVLDVSGSMEAQDVSPTRLAAAQQALHTFLAKVPARLKVGLVLFAGEAQVATPPTTDHALVGQAVDDANYFRGFGGTAIGDAIATAVRVGLRSAGLTGSSVTALPSSQDLADYVTAATPRAASTLVSILFLSDGHQTRGVLAPLAGADKARAAGIPVYTVALGTTGNTTMRGFPGGGGFQGGGGGGFGRPGLAPDPKTLRAIADRTGGKFFRAKSAGAVEQAYSALGSTLGRKSGHVEVTDWFLIGAAILLVLAGVLSALWSPRLP
ncbi:MAG: Ca-activated chloride channel [Gaiellaceae bacterium]|jgi:Ca-activated chloride channel family protein|nr:Ca-activated chloride channel [Gaiellaceae bacterium]